ncbi:hypothetical protein [uncultured Psychrobacter sp.]|uniref:hypothetical protein n=1 Tax=Psychrobacter sp. 1176_08 TaxID=2604452 RepID=UPI0025959D3E|nr:hypothetical protein [uncultured Psychrobacter sp.]
MAEQTGIINQTYGMKSTMGTTNLKPNQKLINLNRDKLLIHPQAEQALIIWQRLRLRSSSVSIRYLDKFYCPPIRVIKNSSDTYYFIGDFERVNDLLRVRDVDSYPCLVTPESIKDIQMLAWSEVVQLTNLKNINHLDLFKALKQTAPSSVICKLMRIEVLSVESYCQYAGIKKASFEYQQCRRSIENDVIGIPKNMDWLVN